jgi:hypothetical protein
MSSKLKNSKTRFYTVSPRVIIRHQSARTPARAKSKILSLEHTLEHTPLEHTPLEHTPLEHTPLEHIPLEHIPLEHIPLAPYDVTSGTISSPEY